MTKLLEKVILVTGAARGIDLGCAMICLKPGAKVAILARDFKATRPIIKRSGYTIGEDVGMFECDHRKADQMEAAFEEVVQQFGRLDGVINNVGWHLSAMTIEEISLGFRGAVAP